MKKLITLFILIVILISMLINTNIVVEGVEFSIRLCTFNLIPSLFPFLILSSILTNYGFVEVTSELLKKIFTKVFHLNSKCAYILVLSILSGSPSNSKYIKELLEARKIDLKDANQILLFSHFLNPIFILNTVGLSFLNSKKSGLIILLSLYISNFIIGLFLRPKEIPKYDKLNLNTLLNKNKDRFISSLTKGINDATNTIIIIFGLVTCSVITSSLINHYFNYPSTLNGLLEVTSGLKYVSTSNYPLLHKLIISSFLVSFGGISIHMQVLSILDNKKIRYIPYLEARIIQGILSSLISIILYILI